MRPTCPSRLPRTSYHLPRAIARLALPLCLVAMPLLATETKLLRQQSAPAFAAGQMDGLALDSLGGLQLADRMERIAAFDEPFLFSAVRLPDGWAVGTGNSGRVVKVDAHGKVTQLFQAPEAAIFALWADPDGTVYAGSSPKGKVYRIATATGGAAAKGEVFFDPQQTYIWSLARASDGALLVATGTEGKLFRVDAAGQGKVFYDADDTHVRSLLALPGGGAIIGTAGLGLIQRVGADGTVRALLDSGGREIVALAAAPDGTVYAAVTASEAGLPEADLMAMQAAAQQAGAAPAQAGTATTAAPTAGSATVSVSAQDGTAKSPRSEIFRIAPNGSTESLWAFQDETVYSLAWHRGELWVGTGLEGKIFAWNAASAKMVLQKDADERQIMALLSDGDRLTFASTNAAALYRSTGAAERHGTYTSAALDAGQPSRFGVLRWRGETPRGTTVRLSVRTGLSGEPDRTWSAWSEWSDDREIALAAVPPGRYLQWRMEMNATADVTPRVVSVETSFRHLNQRPRLLRFSAMEPGEVLVPQNFTPGAQVYEPAHPTADGMFTSLGEAPGGDEARNAKTLWKKGYRTLRWDATDANDDKLVYALEFRREGDVEGWLPMAKDLDDNWYSFDETALPDGMYRFRVRASDRKQNPDEPLEAEQVSEPVLVDDGPPHLVSVAWEAKRLRVVVEDDLNPLRTAEVSIDGGEWRPARPADGLLDGRRETLWIDLPAAPKLVILRVMDAAWNVATFDLPAKGGGQ